MQQDRDYQPVVAKLLGETAAVTALIAAQLKQSGRLTLQLRGNGPVQLLVPRLQRKLQIRGMARSNPVVLAAPAHTLLGAEQGGQLMMSPIRRMLVSLTKALCPWLAIPLPKF